MAARTKQLMIRVTDQTYQYLETLSETTGLSMSAVVALFLDRAVGLRWTITPSQVARVEDPGNGHGL